MKAIVLRTYGPPETLRLEDWPTPEPRAGELRVKVHAASVNSADHRLVRADPFLVRLQFGLRRPRPMVLGLDMAGTVDAVGEGVTDVQPGDKVFADLYTHGFGTFAEYVRAPATAFVPLPANLDFVQAAALPAAAGSALLGLRDYGGLQAGQHVLLHGASGGVGTAAVQIAKASGAEVTALCSTRNTAMVRELGADHVIDYTRQDFAQLPQRYDLILGISGGRSIFDYRRALKPGGTYVMVGGSNKQLFQALLLGPLLARTGAKRFRALTGETQPGHLRVLKELAEAGQLKPVIDRTWPLAEAAQALRHMEDVHTQGKLVLTL